MITICERCGRQWDYATHFVGIQNCPHCWGYGTHQQPVQIQPSQQFAPATEVLDIESMIDRAVEKALKKKRKK